MTSNLASRGGNTHYERSLSSMERMALHMPNANVVLAVRVRRAIDVPDIERALPALQRRHPMLGVRVEIRDAGRAHFMSQGVELPEVIDAEGGSLEETISQQHQRGFAWDRGPMLRLCRIPDGDRTLCMITAHHATCDGLSLFFVLRDLVEWISTGRFTLPDPHPVGIQDAAPATRTPWVERQMMGLLGRKWRRKGISFAAADTERLHERFWSKHESRAILEQLTQRETASLLEASRRRAVTVGNLLTTACLKAQAKVQHGSPIADTTLVSVSLADRLRPPATGALGFYATGVRVAHAFDTTQTLWENAKAFAADLAKLLDSESLFAMRRLEFIDPGLIDALAFARGGLCDDPLAMRLLSRSGKDRVMAGLLMANLGLLTRDDETAGDLLDAVYGPFVCSDTTEKYMAAATVHGRLNLSLSHDKAVLSPAVADSFFGEVLQELRQIKT